MSGRRRVIEWPRWFVVAGNALALLGAWGHDPVVVALGLLAAFLGGAEIELRLRGLSRGGRGNGGRGPR